MKNPLHLASILGSRNFLLSVHAQGGSVLSLDLAT